MNVLYEDSGGAPVVKTIAPSYNVFGLPDVVKDPTKYYTLPENFYTPSEFKTAIEQPLLKTPIMLEGGVLTVAPQKDNNKIALGIGLLIVALLFMGK